MKYKPAKLNDADNCLEKQWFVYYSYQHPETGEMKRFKEYISLRLKTRTLRRQKADELIKKINSNLKRGWNPFSDQDIRLTNIVEAINFALSLKTSTIKKRTKQTYNSLVNHFIGYLEKNGLSKIPIDEINKKMVQDYFDNILLNENISKRTYNNRLTPLRTIFNILYKREYLTFNPFLSIEKLKVDQPEITAFTKKDLEVIKNTLPEYNFELYIISQLIYYCFLRPAEIVRLQYKDILWDHDIILIPGTKSKNKKSEVIILPDQLKKNLRGWNLNQPKDFFIFSRKLKPGDKEIAPTRIAEEWRKYADEFNIQPGIYNFKHTGNGCAFDQGFNSRDIQLQNRHSSLDETQKYLNKFRRVASDKFKEEFNGY